MNINHCFSKKELNITRHDFFPLRVFESRRMWFYCNTTKKSLEVVPPLCFYKGTIGIPFFVVDTIAFTMISYSFSTECK